MFSFGYKLKEEYKNDNPAPNMYTIDFNIKK